MLKGGGNLERGRQNTMESERAEGARKFSWVFRENSVVFLLNNALVYMFLRIQNESLLKEYIWVRIRGAFPAKKRGPKLNFHREGGSSSHNLLPKSATDLGVEEIRDPLKPPTACLGWKKKPYQPNKS